MLIVGIMLGVVYSRGPSIPLVHIAELPEFGALPVGANGEAHPVVIQSAGTGPLTIESIAASTLENEVSTEFVVDPGNCERTRINPGGNCAVKVSFHPQGLGLRQARLVLVTDAPDSPQAFLLGGMGYMPPHPEAYVRPEELDFGTQKTNSQSELPLLIANRGDAPLKVGEISFSGEPGPFTAVPETCSDAEIAPNSDCKMRVTFFPQNSGAYNAVLAVHHGDTWPLTVPVRGIAEGPLEGYCCVKGRIQKSDEESCRVAGGFFSQDPNEMKRRCRDQGSEPAPPPTPTSPVPETPVVVSTEPPTPDREAPRTPTPIEPGTPAVGSSPSLYPCGTVVLRWTSVDDPSQPVSYLVSLEAAPSGNGPWGSFQGFSPTQDTQLALPQLLPPLTVSRIRTRRSAGSIEGVRRPPPPPAFFRWQVSASDAVGNTSPPSDPRYFHCQAVIQ